MSLRQIANGVEALVGVALVATIVLLFTNSPTAPPAAPAEAVTASGIDGGSLYGQRCAGCHGGDGSGGIGPRLAGGRMAAVFPDPADQVSVVTNGRGGMPSFSGRLTAEEIDAIVEYTRTVLADVQP